MSQVSSRLSSRRRRSPGKGQSRGPFIRLLVVAAIVATGVLVAVSGSAVGRTHSNTAGARMAGAKVPASSTSAADLPTSFSKPSKPYTIVLSNNYVGNSWRLQMEKEAQVAANTKPFKGLVDMKVVTSQDTVQAQIQDLQNIISEHPNAIIIDAGSPTALNGTIAQACQAGIVVVSFDQLVTAPCAWKVGTDFKSAESVLAQWLVQVLGEKGEIAVDRGLPGTSVGAEMLSAEMAVYKKYPGIKVVSEFNGQYAFGPEKEGVAAALASHPALVGATTDNWGSSALAAFQSAGKKKAAIIGWGPMGALVSCAKAHAKDPNINCIFGTNGPSLSINAMQLALSVLEKRVAGRARFFKTDEVIYATKVLKLQGMPTAKLTPIVLGKDALPGIPPSTGLPYSLSFMNIKPSQVAVKSSS